MFNSAYHNRSDHLTPQGPRPRYLEDLIRRPQWVAHRAKKPINPATGALASPTDPQTWGTYSAALAMVTAGRADGIGSVLIADDPYTVIDLDKCRNAETGQVDPDALAIVDRFNSYTEVSPSGTGLHIWIRATIPGDRKRSGRIEMYDRERYMTVTGKPLPGYSVPIRAAQDELEAFYADVFPAPVASSPAAAATLTLEDRDILDLLQRESTGKGAALLRSDICEYSSHSEARAALAWKARYYHADEGQIARILLSADLFKAGTPEREKERKAAHDAKRAVETFTGAYYEPNLTPDPRLIIAPTIAPTADTENLTVDELRARLARAEAERDTYRDAFNAMTQIIAVEDLDASTRLTACGVLLVGMEFQAKGRKTSKHGDYHMPASWIGRYSGQKPQTVNRQLNRLQDAGLIDRKVRQETTLETVEMVGAGGEILGEDTYERKGNKNYIALPPNVVDIVPRLTGYQKPADAPKRGGARVPKCEKHPDAEGVMRRTVYYCEHCYDVAEKAGEPLPKPLSMTDPVTITRTEAEAETRPDIKHESDTPTVGMGGIKHESDPEPAPSWQDEHRQIYGETYREVSA